MPPRAASGSWGYAPDPVRENKKQKSARSFLSFHRSSNAKFDDEH
jgi:hypothetical protein